MRWQSAVDFTVLGAALYLLLVWGREARALRTFLGILGLRVGGFAARQADLPVTAWVLDTASVVAVVLVLMVFQREIRRGLTRFDVRKSGEPSRSSTTASAGEWRPVRMTWGILLVVTAAMLGAEAFHIPPWFLIPFLLSS